MSVEDRIRNERLKLGATALNTLATASMTVGVLAPAAAFFYGLGAPNAPGWELLLGAGVWASARRDATLRCSAASRTHAAMISGQTYLLFVAPFVMGIGGLVIYLITDRMTRRGSDPRR